MGDLQKMSYEVLVKRFGDSAKSGGGIWIWRIARGVCLEQVSGERREGGRGKGRREGGREGGNAGWMDGWREGESDSADSC